jgi:hypothetical protein
MSFRIGERVKVDPRDHGGHHRTPRYIKGRVGEVVARHGAYRNPEGLAYHADGLPKKELVRVRFHPSDLFADYRGAPQDLVEADVFEHWLSKV